MIIFYVLIKIICLNSSTNDLHALILARGGSKGIPLKNLVEVNGLSLLSRSIITISNSSCFKHIWVSTDDEKIAVEAKKCEHLKYLLLSTLPKNRFFL